MHSISRMRTYALLGFSLVLAAACSTSAPPGSTGPLTSTEPPQAKSPLPRTDASKIPASSLDAAVRANNAFALALFQNLATKAGSTNLVTSPLSAAIALSMTRAGAKNQTASQMDSALHYDAPTSTVFEGQNALMQALDGRAAGALQEATALAGGAASPPSPDDYQLQVVNSVWGQKDFSWEQPFLDTLARDYGTGIYLVDFAGDAEGARGLINNWVSVKTAHNIEGLLPPDSLTAETKVVLVNAIHLRLPWATAFDSTTPGTFKLAEGKTEMVSMLSTEQGFLYADDGKAQVVSVPLRGGLTAVFALPRGDLASYEADIAAGHASIAEPKEAAEVALELPKFTFDSGSFSLAHALQDMGMKEAFEPERADFSGIHAGGGLHVDDVVQKTHVAVREEGVEAAAATAVIVSSSSSSSGSPATPIPMVIDHPFLMSIVDSQTHALLFLGQIEDPGSGS